MNVLGFMFTFFTFFGQQNDYLYPRRGESFDGSTPHEKKHLWKTRIGLKTAWKIAKAVN